MIDFSVLFSQLFSTYWWLLPLFVLIAVFKSAWFKGFIGEVMVNIASRLFLYNHVSSNNSIPYARHRNLKPSKCAKQDLTPLHAGEYNGFREI